ncbi:TPA: transcriptional regulator [Bacillus thuringiensis]|uniref:Transcriptional regulator n=1 Tax=Bacillus thuringiensis serovar iberica TaxID=180866 RepID=A0A9X6LGF9_BACTU|nr:transcriptional regulator [Bacillus thuringiensis serovar iberica]OUB45314.1 transcriptional regulator [Bacillus thuringiensis serovar iberica]OUB48366.1 transcriptional regulator [Bacillus thuringiensis serovar iberica]OUB48447.1 transcriptional regulator [Bacillus thuringiensis serovar iberica]HDR5353978.1 transcriptional regulator [Bacillus thuringiensis]
MMESTTEKLKGATFKYIESELYSYGDTLREIAFLRKNLMYCLSHDDENIGGGRRNVPPTERIGTKLVVHKKLRRLEELADAIEHVYVLLELEKQKLVKLKYWTKPQCKTWDGIAEELHITKRTALRWRDGIVYAIAEKLGER